MNKKYHISKIYSDRKDFKDTVEDFVKRFTIIVNKETFNKRETDIINTNVKLFEKSVFKILGLLRYYEEDFCLRLTKTKEYNHEVRYRIKEFKRISEITDKSVITKVWSDELFFKTMKKEG